MSRVLGAVVVCCFASVLPACDYYTVVRAERWLEEPLDEVCLLEALDENADVANAHVVHQWIAARLLDPTIESFLGREPWFSVSQRPPDSPIVREFDERDGGTVLVLQWAILGNWRNDAFVMVEEALEDVADDLLEACGPRREGGESGAAP